MIKPGDEIGNCSTTPAARPWTPAWIAEGVRWRCIAIIRKTAWAYRGIRWRCIAIIRKTAWAYRGIRWRCIAIIRKVYWRYRRATRFAVGWSRRRAWAAVRVYRQFGRSARQLGTAIRWTQNPSRLLKRHRLRKEADRLLCLMAGAEIPVDDSDRLERRLRRRVARLAQRPLAPANAASKLVAEISATTRWDRHDRSRVSESRLVRVCGSLPARRDHELIAVIPPLLSGRPVVDTEMRGLPYLDLDEARVLNENARMRMASHQLRKLVTSSILREPPRIGVILSSNRPSLLPAAIAQLRAQRHVEVELRVGIHSKDEFPDLGEISVGAIVDASIVRFDPSDVFGDVLQELTDAGSTEFLTQWDDDDRYGPFHLFDLWLLAKLSRRHLVGRAAEFVHLEEQNIVVRRRGGPIHTDSRFLAGGALLISRRVLTAVGGWSSIPRRVDQDLIERFERSGFPGFRASSQGFALTRSVRGHTWEVDDSYFLSGADGAWGSGGLHQCGVEPPPGEVNRASLSTGRTTIALCIPNKENQASNDRLEQYWSGRKSIDKILISDDRSEPALKLRQISDQIEVTPVPDSPGFGAGRARDHAARKASSDIFAFADADVHVSEPALKAIAALHRAEAVAVHSTICFSSIDSDQGIEILTAEGAEKFERTIEAASIDGQEWREPHWSHAADLAHPRSSSFRACVGGFVSVDRLVYEQTGGFRDVPVRGVEDVEFGYRLQTTGCKQLLYRGGGIVHLGKRTFASALSQEEEKAREQALATWVPIWSRTLAERAQAAASAGPAKGPPVPLIALPENTSDRSTADANTFHGAGTAIAADVPWDAFAAPFCIADRPLSASTIASLDAVMQAFRNGACGEVVVLDGLGQTEARITALWAINRHRASMGVDPILTNETLDAEWNTLNTSRGWVRDQVGFTFVQR